MKYVLTGDQDETLYKRGVDSILLKCINDDESKQILAEVHEGICGSHQSGIKMKWLIHIYGYYWPSVLKDCIKYAQGYVECQKHGPIPRIPASDFHAIIKLWPFREWAMDLIGKIISILRKKNRFIIVVVDYFTKWVEAKSYKELGEFDVIQFIKEMIVHRFGIP